MNKKVIILTSLTITLVAIAVVLIGVTQYMRYTYKQEVFAIESASEKKRTEIQLLDESHNELNAKIAEQESTLAQLWTTIEEEEQQIVEMQADSEYLATVVTEHEAKFATYKTTNEALALSVSELTATKQEKRSAVAEIGEQCNALQTEIDTLEVTLEKPRFPQNPVFVNPDGKIAYLTFDDGPSKYTPMVLDILKQYNIKATFFVTYKTSASLIPYYARIVEEGHTIAIHTASHDYKKIYASFDAWKEDYEKIWNYVYELTGVKSQLYRFPGGSVSGYNEKVRDKIREYLNYQNVIFYDWNVVNGDGGNVSADEAYHNVVDNIGSRQKAIILMHDATGKQTTVDSLPEIIETLLEKGYQFDKLDATVKPIQMSW